MHVNSKEYQEHEIFGDLTIYATFYNRLSELNMSWITQGINGLNIDTYVFTSIQGTLESIFDILKRGRINDAYALLRKYYDSAIINIYSNLYLEENFSIENFVVEKIDNWVKGKDSIPGFEKMSKYIINSKKVEPMTKLMYVNGDFKGSPFEPLRKRCNDHTHYLYYGTLLLNDNTVYLDSRMKIIDTFRSDMREVFILHLGYLFFFNDHYMMSTDYTDCLDVGIAPEVDSQYWVAPFIQAIFNSVLNVYRPDVVNAIKQNTKMQLS